MQNLTIKQKLIFISILPILALMYLSGLQIQEGLVFDKKINQTKTLVDLSEKISLLIHETQKERGASAGFTGSRGAKFKEILPTQRLSTDKRRTELFTFIKSMDKNNINSDLQNKITQSINFLNQLESKRTQISSLYLPLKEVVGYYTTMNASFLDIVSSSAKLSPENSITKSLVAYTDFLKSKERAGIERAVMSATFGGDSFKEGFYRKFINLVAEQNSYMDGFLNNANDSMLSIYKEKMSHPSVGQVEQMRLIAYDKYAVGGFEIDAEVWFATITKKINALKAVDNFIANDIQKELENFSSTAIQSAVVGLIAIFLLIFTSSMISKSILSSIKMLNDNISDIAVSKDFTTEIEIKNNDEFGKLQLSLKDLIRSLQITLNEAKTSARQNQQGTKELDTSLNQITQNIAKESDIVSKTQTEANDLQDILTTSEDQAQQSKESIYQANHKLTSVKSLIFSTIDQIQENSHSELEVADKLNHLSSEAEQVKGVLTVIGDIADQTNLLALNAAIEAARAGEHGRGFAVVADEVRQLAERTQKSLAEINATISVIVQAIMDASGEMNKNVQNIEKLSEKSLLVQNEVEEVSIMISDATASVDQASKGIDQSSNAMKKFMTRIEEISILSSDNNTNVQKVEKTAKQINSLSKNLEESLDQFRT